MQDMKRAYLDALKKWTELFCQKNNNCACFSVNMTPRKQHLKTPHNTKKNCKNVTPTQMNLPIKTVQMQSSQYFL